MRLQARLSDPHWLDLLTPLKPLSLFLTKRVSNKYEHRHSYSAESEDQLSMVIGWWVPTRLPADVSPFGREGPLPNLTGNTLILKVKFNLIITYVIQIW